MRPDRKEVLEMLMDCHGDRDVADLIERLFDEVEAGGGVIAEPRPADDGPSEVAGMPATGTRGEIDWLQANVVAIGETCADNASRLTDVEAVTRQYGDEINEAYARVRKLDQQRTEQLQRLTTLTARVEVLEAASNRRRGDRVWRGLRWLGDEARPPRVRARRHRTL